MMKIINTIDEKQQFSNKQVACLGFFDGLHIGHQLLTQTVLKEAKENNYQSLFFTFSIAPKKIILQQQYDDLLDMDDKQKLVSLMGFDNFVIFPFNDNTRKWSIEQFIFYLKQLNIDIIVVGDDFRFANFGLGNISHLQKNFSKVIVVNKFLINNDIRVSTTYIRQLLQKKQIVSANKLLLQPYNIKGIVVKGNKLGNKIQFPTANIHLNDNFSILNEGVYINNVSLDNKNYQAISCIIRIDNVLKCESYILNFNNNIYGVKIKISFLKYLRDNVAVKSLEHLKQLISEDYSKTLEYFRKIG